MDRPCVDRQAVCEVGLEIARPFIERWHYSGRVPTGKNIFFGWYVSANGNTADASSGKTLYAIADYGTGVNPYQAAYLAKQTGLPVISSQLVELKRLCRIDPKIEAYPLTAFLSRCHKLLKQRGFAYVVSFSDPYHGHSGGIYKAANFEHLGMTNAEYHVQDASGEIRHRRFPYRFAKRKGISVAEARTMLGCVRVKMPPKDRWFLKL